MTTTTTVAAAPVPRRVLRPSPRRNPPPRPVFSEPDVDQAVRATTPPAPLLFSHRARPDTATRATAPAARPLFQAPPALPAADPEPA